MPTVQYPPPPLTRGQLTWRYGLAIAWWLMVTTFGWVAWFNSPGVKTPWQLQLLDVVLGVGCLVLVGYRRRWPLGVALAIAAVSGWSMSAFVVLWWAIISLSTRRNWREIVPATLVLYVSWLLGTLTNAGTSEITLNTAPAMQLSEGTVFLIAAAIFMVMPVPFVLFGLWLGERRDLVASLEERAAQAVREQELRVAQGQAEERQRIAREMHDVLAHRISLTSLHAGVLAHRTDLTPEETRQVAETIRDSAHSALTELRGVLGALRASEDVDKPQPTLVQLDDLLADSRAVGMTIDYAADAALGEVSATTSRHAYRIVQEGLTNARKHASGARVIVRLSGDAESGLVVQVSNPLRVGPTTVPGSGFGLVGLAERAQVAGGRIEHGVVGNEFRLEAWLPW